MAGDRRGARRSRRDNHYQVAQSLGSDLSFCGIACVVAGRGDGETHQSAKFISPFSAAYYQSSAAAHEARRSPTH